MSAIFFGLLAGLATIGLSELLIRFWGSGSLHSFWKVLLVGAFLRAAWVLGLLAAVLMTGIADAKPFTIALLAGYLVGQITEGLRYQRLIRTQ
jgi:hypothetical protein